MARRTDGVFGFPSRTRWPAIAQFVLWEYWQTRIARTSTASDYERMVNDAADDLERWGRTLMVAIGGVWGVYDEINMIDLTRGCKHSFKPAREFVLKACADRLVPSRYEWEVSSTNGGNAWFVITREHRTQVEPSVILCKPGEVDEMRRVLAETIAAPSNQPEADNGE